MLKALSRGHLGRTTELKDVLDGYELPTFPAIYLDALKQVRDDSTTVANLADVMAMDPGLTMRLLQTVNSAAFGLRTRIESVHHAVSLLGRGHLESMLISLASRSTLPSVPCDGFEPSRFWRASARRAATARALADRIEPAQRSACFTAGLLQDMAIPMLCARRGKPYAELLEQWRAGQAELHVLELETFGWDHAEVAMLMCKEWEFPESISAAIAAHHKSGPEVGQLSPVNLVASIPEAGEDAGIEHLVERAQIATGLDREEVHALVTESFRHAEEIAAQFG